MGWPPARPCPGSRPLWPPQRRPQDAPVSAPAEHLSLEAVPAAVLVVAGDAVVYANAQCDPLFGRGHESLLRLTITEQIEAWVEPDDLASVHTFNQLRLEGREQPSSFWFRLRTGGGRVTSVLVRNQPGPRPGERTYLFLERPPEALTERITEALTTASWALVPLRDETAVLEADTEFADRFYATITNGPIDDHRAAARELHGFIAGSMVGWWFMVTRAARFGALGETGRQFGADSEPANALPEVHFDDETGQLLR